MAEPRVTFEHARVGKIEIDASRTLHFAGLPGFPAARNFALVPHGNDSAFAWLASLDQPDLAFVVAEPGKLFPEVPLPIAGRDLAAVGAASREEVLLLAIANLSGGDACLNLAAPILVNVRTRSAAQVVLADATLPLRARLDARDSEAQIESKPHR
jgi:flagellar assembly factor FliW